jgi:hypothetical protein
MGCVFTVDLPRLQVPVLAADSGLAVQRGWIEAKPDLGTI